MYLMRSRWDSLSHCSSLPSTVSATDALCRLPRKPRDRARSSAGGVSGPPQASAFYNDARAAIICGMKVVKTISVVYGACCLVVVGALLFLLIAGSHNDLGRNILLLFLVSFWSGIPLLSISAWSLKSKREPSRGIGLFMLFVSLAPAVVYLIGMLPGAPTPNGGQVLEHALSIALTFLPVIISLALFLSTLKGASRETR